jgi:hypothetical protein
MRKLYFDQFEFDSWSTEEWLELARRTRSLSGRLL